LYGHKAGAILGKIDSRPLFTRQFKERFLFQGCQVRIARTAFYLLPSFLSGLVTGLRSIVVNSGLPWQVANPSVLKKQPVRKPQGLSLLYSKIPANFLA